MDQFYWIGLKAVSGIGNILFRRLLEKFDTPEAALSASPSMLSGIRGISAAIIEEIRNGAWRRFAEEECRRLESSGARLVMFTSADYPKALFQIPDPPPFIYVKGMLPAGEVAVAVVGSRRATSYGLMTTGKLSGELACRGVCIVSGLARGVDTAAHRGALQAGGKTIGVLGCGIDVIYPPEHKTLAQQIIEHGALISEYPLGTKPDAGNFPPRNRIISGLALGALIVEGDESTGARITIEDALEQGRETFAVPGNIFHR